MLLSFFGWRRNSCRDRSRSRSRIWGRSGLLVRWCVLLAWLSWFFVRVPLLFPKAVVVRTTVVVSVLLTRGIVMVRTVHWWSVPEVIVMVVIIATIP